MPNESTLSIVLRLQDDASAKLRTVANRVESFSRRSATAFSRFADHTKKFGASMENFGRKARNAGIGISIGLTAPIILLGKRMIDASLKFSTAMELIRTQSGATQKEVDKMTKSILKFSESGKTGQTPIALASGLKHFESLGFRGKKAMEALKVSGMAADISGANIEDISSALGGAMVTKIKGVTNLSRTMGALDAIIGQGNMSMQELTAAMGTGFLSVAKTFGVSLSSVGAALATMTDNGVPAVRAATRLRMSMSLMGAPSSKAVKEMKKIGITQLQLATDMRKKNGLNIAFEDLASHLKKTGFSVEKQTAILSGMFGGGRTGAAIMLFVNELERGSNKFVAINKQADLFTAKWKAWANTPQGKINLALATMKGLMQQMAITVLPIVVQLLTVVAKKVREFAGWWNELSPSTQKFIVKLVALVAILGPALIIFGSIATAFGAIIRFGGGILKVVSYVGKLGGAMEVLATGGDAAAGALAGLATFMGGVAFLGVIIFTIKKVYDLIKAFNKLKGLNVSEKKSAVLAYKSVHNPTFDKMLKNATGLKKINLEKKRASQMIIAGHLKWRANRYSGIKGVGNAMFDYAESGSLQNSTPAYHLNSGKYVSSKQAQQQVYNFHFNGPTVGDSGIKDLITKSIGTINRQTQLRTYAGTRS